jgi:hypothetical protein
MADPTRTEVAPKATASSKSPLIPIDRPAGRCARQSSAEGRNASPVPHPAAGCTSTPTIIKATFGPAEGDEIIRLIGMMPDFCASSPVLT